MEEDGRLTQTTQRWQIVKKKKKIQIFQGNKCKQTAGGLGFDSKQKHQKLHTLERTIVPRTVIFNRNRSAAFFLKGSHH